MPESGSKRAIRISMGSAAGNAAGFWFVRIFRRLGLSAWQAVLCLTAIAFGGVTLMDLLVVGPSGFYGTLYLPFHLALFASIAILLGRETERIMHFAESMGAGSAASMRRTLYSTRWTLVVSLPIEAVYLGSVFLAPGFVATDIFHHGVVLGTFHVFVGASAIWAFAYAARSLHRIGQAPLALKPFTEDRSLGLRPFGSGSLRLVAIYEFAIVVVVVEMILESDYTLTGIPTFVVLGLVGLGLFFLPLVSFRRQMRDAKARELRWIGPRYAELVEAVRGSNGSHVDDGVVGSLTALDKIQRDVQQIHTWPFDEAIVARLASVTILPLATAVVARGLMIIVFHV